MQRTIPPPKSEIVGLTGGAGSGKTEAALFFSRHGYQVLELDALGREILAGETAVVAAIVDEFGDGMRAADGKLDRMALRQRVFGHREELARLDAIFYPHFRRRVQEWVRSFRQRGTGRGVIDGAILHHAGLATYCDRILLVSASVETRIRRLMHRMGMGEDDARAMVEAQEDKLPAPEAVDSCIVNEGSREELYRALDAFLCDRGPVDGRSGGTC